MDWGASYGCLMVMMVAPGLAIGGFPLRVCLVLFMANWGVCMVVHEIGASTLPCRALDGLFLAVALVLWVMRRRSWELIIAGSLALQFGVYSLHLGFHPEAKALNALWLVQWFALMHCVVADAREAVRPIPLGGVT